MTVFVFHLVEVVGGFKVGLEQIFEILRRNANTFVSYFDAHSDEASRSRRTLIRSYVNLNRVV